MNLRAFLLGLASLLSSCASAAQPVAPELVAREPVSQARAEPFSPRSADPARKAKLVALSPRLDELYRKRLEEVSATGGVMGIVLGGELVYAQGFGVRDIGSKAPVDESTMFRMGSVTKNLTSLAIMKLRDEGKIVLDAPAATYLPALGALKAPTTDSPVMTVRHLLTMTSGLAYDDLWGAVTYGYSDEELARFLERGLTFAGAPGERYRYSNLGYALLGKIVEHVSGTPFRAYVSTEILRPLGMSSTAIDPPQIEAERLAIGYYRDGEKLVVEPRPSDGVFAPAGGGYTTLHDYARYAAFHLAAYPPRDDPERGPVRRSTLREMHAGQAWARWGEDVPIVRRNAEGAVLLSAMSYGFGWANHTTCMFEGMVQHGGFEPGYYASVRLLTAHDLGIVTLSTTQNLGNTQTFEATVALLREAGLVDLPPETPSPALVHAREVVSQLLVTWDEAIVAEAFDPLSLKYSWLRNLRQDFERMAREHGKCAADGPITPRSRTHGRFRLACERGAIELTAYLTPAVPPRLQMVEWRQELPLTEQDHDVARLLAAAIGREAPRMDALVAPSVDRTALTRQLARVGGAYGTCSVDKPLWSDGKGLRSFRLRCTEGSLDLSFRLDPKSALVLEVSTARPRAFGAVCAE